MRSRSYAAEMRRAAQRVSNVPSETAQLSFGTVQYVDRGSGPPVLLSHGIYGGHDNATDMVRLVLGDGFRTIGPSRFGYFSSTLPEGATPQTQADAYIELLDHLGLDKVIAVGYSAGSPSTIAFALHNPERLHGVILAAAYLPKPGEIPTLIRPVMRWALAAQPAWWLLSVLAPRVLGRICGVPKHWRASKDEQKVIDSVTEHLFPMTAKRQGAIFDTLVSEPASNAYPLESIAVPTLLLHAPDDPLAGYRWAVEAAARIPAARLATINRGGHLFLGSTDQVHEASVPFVEAALARSGVPASSQSEWTRRRP
jgi:pimeloyl-ACP methyl ester carboxylesterase